jgi:hypothetical protein
MNSLISKVKLSSKGPKWLKSLANYNLKSELLEEIRPKLEVKTDGIRIWASIHVFTDEELQVFIQKIEKQVYNSIACAKIKGSC